MDKSNVIRSSEFHMDVGDILHYTLIVDSGVTPTISLVSVGDNANAEEVPDAVVAIAASDITSSSFTANWNFMENTSTYYLDVATDSAFTSMVAGYNNLSVGSVNERSVVGLTDVYTYYYRVRGANWVGTGISSNTITTTTANEVITDADGNVYTYVTIGTQQWMVENFRSTKYADGTAIPNIVENNDITDYVNWTNSGFNVLTNVGLNITSCISDGSAFHQIQCKNSLSDPDLDVYPYFRIIINVSSFTLNSGTAPYLIVYDDDTADLLYEEFLTDGINTVIIPNHYTQIGIQIRNAPNSGIPFSSCNFSANISITGIGWAEDTTGAYCYYDNDIANKADYGALYNWYAVDNAHLLAPAGWKVPSDVDWWALSTEIMTNGGLLKEIGLTHWLTPNTGATNETGFTALPGGRRTNLGVFNQLTTVGEFWSYDSFMSWGVSYDAASFGNGVQNKVYGYSVRCMRDIP